MQINQNLEETLKELQLNTNLFTIGSTETESKIKQPNIVVHALAEKDKSKENTVVLTENDENINLETLLENNEKIKASEATIENLKQVIDNII